MSTEQQSYLNCNGGCGEQYAEKGRVQYAEDDDEIRSLAEDEGWRCWQGTSGDTDYCPKCVARHLVQLITGRPVDQVALYMN